MVNLYIDKMTKQNFIIIIISLFSIICIGQKKVNLKMESVYLDQIDSSKNCYTIIFPPKLPWGGYIFLLPGFGETAERVMQQSDLARKLALNGFLTIIPTLETGIFSFRVDDQSQQSLKNMLAAITNKYKLQNHNFFIGGYSIGGTCAIKYTQNPSIKPKAIFAIDSPLDFEILYNSAKRQIRLLKDASANEENEYIIEKLDRELGGSPDNFINLYTKLSPYSFSDTTQAAVRKLVDMPIRTYTEPDIAWWMKERHQDFTGMNSSISSAFINELNLLGNSKASLITTRNKGYRKPDNNRHPHSWSIVEPNNLIQWLLKQK
jgi:hypothetical protein